MKNNETRRSRVGFFALVLMALCFSLAGPEGMPSRAFAQANTGDPEIDNCVDAMIRAHASARVQKSLAAQEAEVATATRYRDSPWRDFLGNIGDKYCFRLYQDIYDTLRMLTDPLNLIVSLLNALLNQILNWACSYVTTMLNNALESICLPLPGFSLPGLSLSGPNARYCNGVALSDFIYFQQMPVPTNLVPQIPTTSQLINQTPVVRDIPQQGAQVPLP